MLLLSGFVGYSERMEASFSLHPQWTAKTGWTASWQAARVPSARQWICFNLCLPLLQMSDSVSPRRRRDAPSYLLTSTYIIATTYGFRNSILTFPDGLLSCHKSDYLHPRRAWRANVKGIEFSTAAGGGGGDAKTSNGSEGNITKTRRGRMKFIGEGVLGTVWL